MTWLSDMFEQLQGSKLAVVVSDFLQKKHPRLFPYRKKSPYRCHQLVSGVDQICRFLGHAEKWQVSRRESVKMMNAVWELKRWRDVPSSPSRWQWHPKNFEVLAHWMAPVGVTRLILRIFMGGLCFGLSFFWWMVVSCFFYIKMFTCYLLFGEDSQFQRLETTSCIIYILLLHHNCEGH